MNNGIRIVMDEAERLLLKIEIDVNNLKCKIDELNALFEGAKINIDNNILVEELEKNEIFIRVEAILEDFIKT